MRKLFSLCLLVGLSVVAWSGCTGREETTAPVVDETTAPEADGEEGLSGSSSNTTY